jgi:hypothetical protein
MKRFVGLVTALCILSLPAHAEYTVRQYKELKREGGPGWPSFTRYFNGVGTGFAVANVMLRSKTTPGFYCPPRTLSVTPESSSIFSTRGSSQRCMVTTRW